jgi:anti-sigma B factor antagonist
MAATQCLLHGQEDAATAVLQVAGRATLNDSPAVRRWCEERLASGATRLEIDLRHCSYLDSTFLGTLLRLQKAAVERQGQFVLVSPAEACCTLLRGMGLWPIFRVISADERPAGQPLPHPSAEPAKALQAQVVEAHEALASLRGPAGERFRAAADCLAKEWTKR